MKNHTFNQEPKEAYKSYVELIEQLDRIFIKIALNHFIVADCMNGLTEKLYNKYGQFIEFVISINIQEYGRAKNAIDTAVLAAAIAARMNLSISQIYKIIEGALLHDVGMLCIPQEILDKQKSLQRMNTGIF